MDFFRRFTLLVCAPVFHADPRLRREIQGIHREVAPDGAVRFYTYVARE
jgi:hypothetical protein